ncbi:hypothetical protein L2E82_35910 [Cichorium intybus]|uniref:Uncharacterized protein n=1 Tax=Cichorium intybus TaxID=13427 RepID=A0ACB9BQ71_CICIN|nr:hypothetical protein L2E82_35910 [Cichorium intybus]
MRAGQAIEGLEPKRKRILYFHFEETTRNEGQVARSEGRRAFRMERKCFHEILIVALEAKLTVVKLVLQTKLSMSKEARRGNQALWDEVVWNSSFNDLTYGEVVEMYSVLYKNVNK